MAIARPRWAHRAATAALVLLAGCTSTGRTYLAPGVSDQERSAAPGAAVAYRVLLIGDAGAVRTDGRDPVLATLQAHAQAAGPQSITVFLGDNLYVDGLPPQESPDRARGEAILGAQIDAVRDAPGRVLFIPGNHDWKNSKEGGLQQLREQEAFVEARLGDKGAFLPSNGFPGPVRLDLGERLRLVVIDTEWWLGQHERAEGEDAEATTEIRDDADFLAALSDEVVSGRSRRLLVVGHHPVFSNSNHGGVASLQKQLSPPVLGTVAAFVRRSVGKSPQDLAHPRYAALRGALQNVLSEREDVVYAAGHEHTLQYFPARVRGRLQHHLVSGSGAKSSYVTGGRGAAFTSPERGFMVLTYFDDGSARMDAIRPREGQPLGDTLVSVPLMAPDPDLVAPPVIVPPAAPPALAATATGVPSTKYDEAGWLARTFLGEGYRKTWALPVTVPVFDIGREAGGLSPTRLGGSRQTQSVRLVDARGREYVLRSLDKTPNNPLSLGLRYGIARDVAEDLTSAMYPYGTLVAARLSQSAGLYHTAPRLVYVPDDPRFGPYRADFANQLMLFEQRPDGSARGLANQGNADDVLSTTAFLREIDGDVDHRLDAPFFLRARLFDMLIGDWDRHADQWRWAAYEPGELDPALEGEDATRGKRYRPIARDRDWALNDRDGLLFRLARPFVPKLTGFQPRFGNLHSLTFNGRNLDQRFLAELSRDDWKDAAESLQKALPDSVLEAAVARIPEPARGRDGAEILRRLKLRRDALKDAALSYYRLRAREVDVIGTQDNEVIRAERDGDRLELTMYRRKSDGTAGQRLWRRTFRAKETKEVRVWARGGQDRLEVEGEGGKIRLRFLGGAGFDEVADATDGARLYLYDTPAERSLTLVQKGPQARVEQSERIVETSVGYVPPTPGYTLPILSFDSNVDDGLRLAVGVDRATPGFLRRPYLRRQRLSLGYATASGGFFGRYNGHFPGLLGTWDAGLDLSGQTALAFRNFFGYGGNSVRDPDASASYYRVQMASANIAPYAARTLNGRLSGRIGPTLAYADPHHDATRYLSVSGLPEADLDPQWLAGADASVLADATDSPSRPSRGLRVSAAVRARTGLLDASHRYAGLRSGLGLYFTKQSLPWATLAVRMGGEHLIGTFPFYDAATLGGIDNLRGYRLHRFAGRSSLYGGVEPRVRLNRFRAVFWPEGEFGVLGFADAGRVWADNVAAGPWRTGYGAGFWLALSSRLGGTLTYDVSDETRAVSARFGFAF